MYKSLSVRRLKRLLWSHESGSSVCFSRTRLGKVFRSPDVGLLPNERFAEIISPHSEDLAAHCDHYLMVIIGSDRACHRSVVHPLHPKPPRRFAIHAHVGGEFVASPRYATKITCCRRLHFNPLYAVDIKLDQSYLRD